ncbi:hypothetical protein V9T40_005795 [Parthenolecanium corni]|uniref:Uncharacterized protein n=1 Tax=Parthenolecanium corni TaxID=536013 RepID=A0AAN9YAT7_9HEMI
MLLVVNELSCEGAQRKNYKRDNVGCGRSLCLVTVPMIIANIFTDSQKFTIPKRIKSWLNNWLFELHQFWYHLGNVLLHAICSGLFTRIALAIVGLQMRFAALAGVLFASHPIHTEAVAGIVGRADVLACLFFILSFLTYHE